MDPLRGVMHGARACRRRLRQQQRQQRRWRRQARPPATQTKVPAGKQGGTLTFLAAGDVDYLDPGQTYYTFGYHGRLRDATGTLYSFKPDDSRQAGPGPRRRRRREISTDNKTITVKIKQGVKYAPAGQPRGQDRGHQVRHRARLLQARSPAATRARTSARSSARPDKPNSGDVKPISGIKTPDDHTIVFKLKDAERAARLAALVMPITVPGARGVREEVRREEPVDVRPVRRPSPARTWSRTTRTGKVDRPRARQVDRHRPQPELGHDDGLPSGLPGRDQDRGGQRRPRRSPRAARCNGSDTVCCDAGSPPAPVLKQALTQQQGPGHLRPVAAARATSR